jgi:hypothetical protein
MFGKTFVDELITRSSENKTDRRLFLKAAGVTGLGAVAVGALGTGVAQAGTHKPVSAPAPAAPAPATGAPSDAAILNFALNLEYLEAEFYQRAAFGRGLSAALTSGNYGCGPVTGGRAVPFASKSVKQYAREIAQDELDHVQFLRTALGSAAVGRPAINLQSSFTAAAQAAGLISAGQTFDPFANDDNFLLGAFLFEDVGVTAYKGAAPLISNKTYLGAAAGILAVEAYHAGLVRSSLYERGLSSATNKISAARDSLDGPTNDDQGTSVGGVANIVPTDANGLAFGRTPGQVLNIVYLTPNVARSGGFYPKGVNGEINTSA